MIAAVMMANIAVIPKPLKVVETEGYYPVPQARGAMGSSRPTEVEVPMKEVVKAELGKEAYELEVTEKGVTAYASDKAGFFYARQTLRQLAQGKDKIPCVKIEDKPRFKYRSFQLDVSRHFFTIDEVKRFIDLMARFKFNTFWWHLVDDHGWRIEIPGYPLLTEKSAWRYDANMDRNGKPYGGFYTAEQLKEVVRFAQERNVMIIPDIDMPGHSSEMAYAYPYLACDEEAAKAAESLEAFLLYPMRNYKRHQSVHPKIFGNGLKTAPGVACVGKETTFKFYEDVLTEVMKIFPGEFINLCGDEVNTKYWKKCPHCQARMKEIGAVNERELTFYVLDRMGKFVRKHGRTPICDDDVLEGRVPDNYVINSWRGIEGGKEAVRRGMQVFMCPEMYCYFNQSQAIYYYQPDAYPGALPIELVYSFDPVPDIVKALGREDYILGPKWGHWAEYINSAWQLELQSFPRSLAASEVAWTANELKNWNDFKVRLVEGKKYLEALGVDYYDETKDYHGWDLYDNDPLPTLKVPPRPDSPREQFIKKAKRWYMRTGCYGYTASMVDKYLKMDDVKFDALRDLGGFNGLERKQIFRGQGNEKTVIDTDFTSVGDALKICAKAENYPIRLKPGKNEAEIAFVLQGIAGARKTDLEIDYELSGFGVPSVRRYRTDAAFQALEKRVEKYPGMELVNQFAAFAKAEYGLNDEEIAAINRRLRRRGFSPQFTCEDIRP